MECFVAGKTFFERERSGSVPDSDSDVDSDFIFRFRCEFNLSFFKNYIFRFLCRFISRVSRQVFHSDCTRIVLGLYSDCR